MYISKVSILLFTKKNYMKINDNKNRKYFFFFKNLDVMNQINRINCIIYMR